MWFWLNNGYYMLREAHAAVTKRICNISSRRGSRESIHWLRCVPYIFSLWHKTRRGGLIGVKEHWDIYIGSYSWGLQAPVQFRKFVWDIPLLTASIRIEMASKYFTAVDIGGCEGHLKSRLPLLFFSHFLIAAGAASRLVPLPYNKYEEEIDRAADWSRRDRQ